MIDLDLDPVDEFVHRWPEGTVFLLLAGRVDNYPSIGEYIVDASSKDYVDWAVNALLAGFEAPSLNVLAGLDLGETPSIWDARRYFDRCMAELKLEPPDSAATLLRAYLFELVSQIAAGEADPHETLDRIHWRIVNPLDHSEDLMPWCYLWEGNTPGGHQGRYSEDEYREAAVAYAQSWLKNGPDVLLSRLGEGLEVTFSPNPVKARLGGSGGQRFEWVFETKVRALDETVRMGSFGTFRRRRGRWVFSTPTGRPIGAKDFAEQYSCPSGILQPGESFSTLNIVSSSHLQDWEGSWYFKGVTLSQGGASAIVKGTAIVRGLAELETKNDVPAPSQSGRHKRGTSAPPVSGLPDMDDAEVRRNASDPDTVSGSEAHEGMHRDTIVATVSGKDSDAVGALLADIEKTDVNVRRAGIAALVQVGELAVEPLLGTLKHGNPGARRSAAVALGQIGGTRAVKPLLVALADSNENVRKAAVAALGQVGDVRALGPLLAALKDSDKHMRNVAAAALWQIGDSHAREPLLKVFEESDLEVRRKAVLALAETGDVRSVETLAIALEDSDEFIRSAVATTLGNLRDGRSVEPLVTALADDSWLVRSAAAEALGQIGESRAVAPLVMALNDSERDVRRAAAIALGWIGDSRAVEPLVAVLEHGHEPRSPAAFALGNIGDSDAVEPLMMALQDDDWLVRVKAVEALGKISDTRALTSLVALQHDASPGMRGAAIRALGHLGDARVVDLLLAALRDEAWYVRDAGVAALVQMGEPAVALLVMALNDSEPDVRRRAAMALGRIGDNRAATPLVEALKDGDENVRKAVAWALLGMGQPAVEPLQLALKGSKENVRKVAAALLAELGVP